MRSSEQQKISSKAEDRGHEEGAEAEWGVARGYRSKESPSELQESPGQPCLDPGTLTLGSCSQNCKTMNAELRCSAGADRSRHQQGPTLAVRGHCLFPCKCQAELSHSPTRSLERILPPLPPCLSFWPQDDRMTVLQEGGGGGGAEIVRVTYDCSEGTAASGSHVVEIRVIASWPLSGLAPPWRSQCGSEYINCSSGSQP